MECLLDAVTKLKVDIENGVTTANLTGCHLFLQIFYLDNLYLGIFNMKHDVGVAEPSFASAVLRDPSTVLLEEYTP